MGNAKSKLADMSKYKRLDLVVVELGLFASRQAAQAAIMDGGILVDGQPQTKAGHPTKVDAQVEIAAGWGPRKYVSRGGLKLEKALSEFAINCQKRICIDVGASTGGFTDCLLKHGAHLVYAVDVGFGQLDWALRNNPQVVVKERFNARQLSPHTLYQADGLPASLAVMDVSFISIGKILPGLVSVMNPDQFEIVCLVKPQFEAGKDQVGKGGVVRSPDVHRQVLQNCLKQAEELKLYPAGLTYSPIKGPAGNIEFLLHLSSQAVPTTVDIESVVEQSQQDLSA